MQLEAHVTLVVKGAELSLDVPVFRSLCRVQGSCAGPTASLWPEGEPLGKAGTSCVVGRWVNQEEMHLLTDAGSTLTADLAENPSHVHSTLIS